MGNNISDSKSYLFDNFIFGGKYIVKVYVVGRRLIRSNILTWADCNCCILVKLFFYV